MIAIRPLLVLGISFALLGPGCTHGSAPPPKTGAAPAASAKQEPDTLRARLARTLRSLPRDQDLLQSLSTESRSDIKGVLSGITNKDHDALVDAQGPLARARPLLHLAVGGKSADAVYLLVSTPRLVEELITYRQAAQHSNLSDVVGSVRTFAERAASSWLHDRSTEVASPVTLTPELLEQVDVAAYVIGRRDIERMARELQLELNPKDARRWISLASQAARDLDTKAARHALEQARSFSKDDRVTKSSLASTELLIAAAEKATGPKPSDLSGALAVARAYLELDRAKQALETIDPHRALAEKNLAVATTLALGELGGTVCPGLPGGVANTMLCGVAWDAHPKAANLVELIERAWKSGSGRDPESVEVYLGLVGVVPWMYGLSRMSVDPTSARTEVMQRLKTLAGNSREAAKVAPGLEGLVLFIDTLSAGFDALTQKRESGESVKIPREVSSKLRERALALGKKSPGERFAQAGVLSVAAMQFRDDDVLPLLELIPPDQVHPSHVVPFNILRLWAAVVARSPKLAGEASGELAAILPDLARGRDTERAEIVLTLAEAEAAIAGTPKAHGVLEQVGKPLAEAVDAPAELRLRAALDVAGARAKQGRMAEAADILARVTTSVPWATAPDNSDAQNLGLLASAYLFVIQARATKGDERAEYRDKLNEIAKRAAGQQLIAASRLWIEMWQKEIDYLVTVDRCGAVKICAERAKQNRRIPEAEAKRRAGSVAAQLVSQGSLPVGTINLSFGYGSALRLDALVRVAPMLLAVESPKE